MADRYKEAGVDIEAGEEAVRRIKDVVASTRIPGVVGGIGGFGGLFDLAQAGFGGDTMLVSGADGVGTKLKLAFLLDKHDTVGIDCVAMCVNDILTLGAKPLFFLDYIATGKLEPGAIEALVSGIAAGCRESGCALLGGETAEMPGFYPAGEYDVAGFAVGAIRRDAVIDGSGVGAGDTLIGLRSSGVHSNGFSLVRKVLVEGREPALKERLPGGGKTLGETLLEPTRLYVRPILGLLDAGVPVRAMVHVTGGGLIGNVPRVLPDGLGARFDQQALDSMGLPIFDHLQEVGQIAPREMFEVFNMGVGYIVVVPEERVDQALDLLGPDAKRLGVVVPHVGDADRVAIPSLGATR